MRRAEEQAYTTQLGARGSNPVLGGQDRPREPQGRVGSDASGSPPPQVRANGTYPVSSHCRARLRPHAGLFGERERRRQEVRILGFGRAGPFQLPSEAQKWSCECELMPQRALARVRGTETLGLGCSGWVLALRLGRTS